MVKNQAGPCTVDDGQLRACSLPTGQSCCCEVASAHPDQRDDALDSQAKRLASMTGVAAAARRPAHGGRADRGRRHCRV